MGDMRQRAQGIMNVDATSIFHEASGNRCTEDVASLEQAAKLTASEKQHKSMVNRQHKANYDKLKVRSRESTDLVKVASFFLLSQTETQEYNF